MEAAKATGGRWAETSTSYLSGHIEQRVFPPSAWPVWPCPGGGSGFPIPDQDTYCTAVGEQPQAQLWDSPVSRSPHCQAPTPLPLLEVTAERRSKFPVFAWLLGLAPWHTTNPLRTQVPQG